MQNDACYEGGSGPPLVLLHGVGGSWHIWRPVIGLVEGRYRVIAPTLPGHDGAPPLPAGADPSVASIADALLDRLAALGVRHAHIVGNSLGGWLALELARRGFALSVTALSPAGAWRSPADIRKLRRSILGTFLLLPLLLFAFGWTLRFSWVRRWLGRDAMEHPGNMPESEFRRSLTAMTKTSMLPALLRNVERHGAIEAFDVGATPVRIVWAEHDRTIPFERYGQPMLQAVRGAQFAILPDAGHMPMYDNPRAVAAHIFEVADGAIP